MTGVDNVTTVSNGKFPRPWDNCNYRDRTPVAAHAEHMQALADADARLGSILVIGDGDEGIVVPAAALVHQEVVISAAG